MFVSVKFRPEDTRTYTYLANETFAVGDAVLVEVKGDRKVVFVAGVDLPEPSFACKPIIGIAPPKEPVDPVAPPAEEASQ